MQYLLSLPFNPLPPLFKDQCCFFVPGCFVYYSVMIVVERKSFLYRYPSSVRPDASSPPSLLHTQRIVFLSSLLFPFSRSPACLLLLKSLPLRWRKWFLQHQQRKNTPKVRNSNPYRRYIHSSIMWEEKKHTWEKAWTSAIWSLRASFTIRCFWRVDLPSNMGDTILISKFCPHPPNTPNSARQQKNKRSRWG